MCEFVQTIAEKEIVARTTNKCGWNPLKKNRKFTTCLQRVCKEKKKKLLHNLEFLSKRFESDQKDKVGGLFKDCLGESSKTN